MAEEHLLDIRPQVANAIVHHTAPKCAPTCIPPLCAWALRQITPPRRLRYHCGIRLGGGRNRAVIDQFLRSEERCCR